MLSLPLELYRPVVDHLTDRSTLLSLMLTCWVFHAEAERKLYHQFQEESLETQRLFIRTVANSPSKAALIRSYTFFNCRARDDDPFWPLFRDFLLAAVNLKELGFGRKSNKLPCSDFLDGCTFQLEVLRWHCHHWDEASLRPFLAKQPAIRSLSVRNWRKSFSLSPDVLPNVKTLIGQYGLIYNFLPHRRITHIIWNTGLDDPNLDSGFPFASLQHVQVLRYGGDFPHVPLSVIANDLVNLVTLELVIANVRSPFLFRKNSKQIINQSRFQSYEIMDVPYMPQLETLIFSSSSMGFIDSVLISRPDRQQLVERLFSQMDTLRYVDMETGARKPGEEAIVEYKRWTRNAIDPVSVWQPRLFKYVVCLFLLDHLNADTSIPSRYL